MGVCHVLWLMMLVICRRSALYLGHYWQGLWRFICRSLAMHHGLFGQPLAGLTCARGAALVSEVITSRG
jgi:hypothetical protein